MRRRAVAGIAAALFFAATVTGAVLLAVQNASLQDQVTSQAAQRASRHTAFCVYLLAQTRLQADPALAQLAAHTYQSEGCTSQP